MLALGALFELKWNRMYTKEGVSYCWENPYAHTPYFGRLLINFGNIEKFLVANS